MANNGLPDAAVAFSTTKPDFETILMQAQMFLLQKDNANNNTVFNEFLTQGTGETLLELFASGVTFNAYAIEAAFRDAFPKHARRDSAVYAAMRMLGVRIGRKVAASVPVTIRRTSGTDLQEVFPRLTQIKVGGKNFFNREPIVFLKGASRCDVTLYEGEVKEQSFVAEGRGFREIYLNEPNFIISDSDVYVSILRRDGVVEEWQPTDEGLWVHEGNDRVYWDTSSGEGDLVLSFGNGIHGAEPQISSTIRVRYAVVSGSQANSAATGLKIEYTQDKRFEGETTAPITGGADEKPAEYYKAFGSHIYRARRRCVSASDYTAIFSDLQQVASCYVRGQKDIAPNDLRYMTMLQVCLLPQDTAIDEFTDQQWEDILTYMKRRRGATANLQRLKSVKKTVDLQLTVALSPNKVPSDVLPQLEANMRGLFARKWDTLGRRISVYDIMQAGKVDGIDYILSNILDDLVPDTPYTYFALSNLVINTKYSERSLAVERNV